MFWFKINTHLCLSPVPVRVPILKSECKLLLRYLFLPISIDLNELHENGTKWDMLVMTVTHEAHIQPSVMLLAASESKDIHFILQHPGMSTKSYKPL